MSNIKKWYVVYTKPRWEKKVAAQLADKGIENYVYSIQDKTHQVVAGKVKWCGKNYTADKLISWSGELRKRINEKYSFVHPENETINGCSHILWTGAVLDKTSTARNAVFYGDKAIDRSPCGTGTSARMAQWYTKGKLKKGDAFIHESIIGSKFIGTIEEELQVAGKPAIRPGIEGWARIYGYNNISIDDEDDPYAFGFQVL